MFEQIELPERKSEITAKCPTCGNQTWKECCLEIKPIIAGGLVIAWELDFGIECDHCQTYVCDHIGWFDDNVNVLTDFKVKLPNVRKLRKLQFTEQIKETYQKLREAM